MFRNKLSYNSEMFRRPGYGPSLMEGLQHNLVLPLAEFFSAVRKDLVLKKDPEKYRHEIEMSLLKGDLNFMDVDKAMAMIPDMDRLFEFLREKDEIQTLYLISSLLL